MNDMPAGETRAGIRVMLVEDHQTMSWGLERLIEGERPRMEVVGIARTGEDAVAMATRLVPDVILLDLDLGGTCSIDYLPRMLANHKSRALVLTGERRSAVLDAALRGGARGIVGKDAPAETLLKAIEKTHNGEIWLDRESMARLFGGLLEPQAPRARDPERDKQASLTERERKIIAAVVDHSDCLNKTLASHLFISEHTLRNHLTAIYHKLGVKTRLELYVYAVKHNLHAPSGSTVH
jgi:two-component system, NarL family, nitrate/nitrite response regulator NarL